MKKKSIKLILLFTSYCTALLLLRIWFSGSLDYIFLSWNLILAFIPLLISNGMRTVKHRPFLFYCLLIAWLFFLPNAPYMITDIFHLKNLTSMPVWFDLLLIISFAINGIFLFYISLYQVFIMLSERFKERNLNLIVNGVLVSTAFGIYIGRFLRWNTWDVIANPLQLFKSVTAILINPVAHPKAWGFTMGYGILLFLVFQFVKMLFFIRTSSKDQDVQR